MKQQRNVSIRYNEEGVPEFEGPIPHEPPIGCGMIILSGIFYVFFLWLLFMFIKFLIIFILSL